MPIIVDRCTGEIMSAPDITQEQRDRLWEAVVWSWAEKNIDKLVELPVEKKTLSVAEAAEAVGVSTRYMYDLVKTKGLPTIQIGRRLLVSAKGLEQWLDEQAQKGWKGRYTEDV